MKKYGFFILLTTLSVVVSTSPLSGKNRMTILQDSVNKTVRITDGSGMLELRLNYSSGCIIDELAVNGKNTLAKNGAFTAVKPSATMFTSGSCTGSPELKLIDNNLTIRNITFGNDSLTTCEEWVLKPLESGIRWDIKRYYNHSGHLDELAIPVLNFSNLSVWKGGILNNGGMVWCKYLTNQGDTYGVHTNGVTFWNPQSGDGLRIASTPADGKFIASKFSHGINGEFVFTQYLSDTELQPRYRLDRFVKGKEDVFAPFGINKGFGKISLLIQYINYNEEYPEGHLPGIDAAAVREIRNTTARYGVVDQNIIGGNGWTTNWKCLHEPFFARIGLFVNDENYTRNYSSTLDQERDQAMTKDGRVLSRWHNEQGDEMAGTYNTKTGYYETQWGYTIDSQTGYVINTAEQFDLNGDLKWLSGHKLSCEKALEWLIKRDINKNGLFEMVNDRYTEKKCSDWIDVVYASFENSFVNAQMYEALNLWADCERLLGDHPKADIYTARALKLKEAFNRNVADGGFWSPEKKCYIYWRDKDGTPHGDNLVTPISFKAIAFGICDDPARIRLILENIETRMVAEQLFHWPLCFDSFKKEEVEKVNWPFPNYENGDIFPTWGYVGVMSYLKYDKRIALKYVKKILEQYHKDGLSSQRFSRKTQEGIGSDILAGICTTVTALYKEIYGVRPRWNRMGLEPNLSPELNGTAFDYTLRGIKYTISLSENSYQLKSDHFVIKSGIHFGANMVDNALLLYPGNRELPSLIITRSTPDPVKLEIKEWNTSAPSWKITSAGRYKFVVNGLKPNINYLLQINGKTKKSYLADLSGKVSFTQYCDGNSAYRIINK
jgi:hypothetical protein